MTQNPKIYRINKDHRLLKSLSSTKAIIGKIINSYLKGVGSNSNFKTDSLKIYVKEEFTYYLYLYNSNEIVSDWQEFLPSELAQDSSEFMQQKLSDFIY